MLNLGKRAYALLLIMFLIPAGCQNPAETATPGIVNGGSTSPSPVTSTAPKDTSIPQSNATPPMGENPGQPAVPITSGGAMGKVTAVRLASSESGWVGGEGWIARTDDGGKHWQNQYLGDGTILQIFALNGQDAWAVTDKANLIGTSDGGTHWYKIYTFPRPGSLSSISPR